MQCRWLLDSRRIDSAGRTISAASQMTITSTSLASSKGSTSDREHGWQMACFGSRPASSQQWRDDDHRPRLHCESEEENRRPSAQSVRGRLAHGGSTAPRQETMWCLASVNGHLRMRMVGLAPPHRTRFLQ
jgi:hypothetical protein